MNTERAADNLGSTLHYGDVVQICHIKCQKYITVRPKEVAVHDKEGFKVSFDEGSEYAWFRLSPRFKLRTFGDPVYFNDQITFDSVRVGGSLYATTFEASKKLCEVSCNASSVQPTAWKVKRFSGPERTPGTHLRYHEVFRLYHNEADGFLSAPTPEIPLIDKNKNYSPQEKAAREEAYVFPPSAHADEKNIQIELHTIQHCKSMFRIEHTDATKGGSVKWTSSFRLRSLVSGRYVAMQPKRNGVFIPDSDNSSAPGRVVLTDDRSSKATEFRFVSTVFTTSEYIPTAIPLKLRSMNMNVLVSCDGKNRKDEESSAVEEEKSYAVQTASLDKDDAAFMAFRVPNSHVADLEALQSLNPVLEQFANHIAGGAQFSANARKQIQDPLTAAMYFVTQSLDLRPLECAGIPVPFRQNLARELRFIDYLFFSVRAPFELARFTLETLKNDQPEIFYICRLMYKLLKHCFEGHQLNQTYIARHRWTEVMMNQIGSSIGAEEALTELLANNRPLLEEQVDDKLINFLISIIWKKGPNPSYLRFLTALCSCEGKAISGNQEDCLKFLVLNDENSKLLATFGPGSDEDRPKWHSNYEMSGSTGNIMRPSRDARGRSVYDNGLFNVEVTWRSSKEEYGMENMFPAKNQNPRAIPLWELCRVMKKQEIHDLPLDLMDAEHRRRYQMCQYIEAQLELFAAICFGRSYNCINTVSQLLPFDYMLSCMKDERLPYSIRASFTKLITATYIDCAPTQQMPVPRLFRDINDLTASLPANTNPTSLFLLQDMAGDYMSQHSGCQIAAETEKNTFTLAILTLICDLIRFGFYSKTEQINMLVVQVVRALDGRNDLVECDENADNISEMSGVVELEEQGNQANAVVLELSELPYLTAVGENTFSNASSGNENSNEEVPRYIPNEQTIIVMNCKKMLCAILNTLESSALDLRISGLLQGFSEVVLQQKSTGFGLDADQVKTIVQRRRPAAKKKKAKSPGGLKNPYANNIKKRASHNIIQSEEKWKLLSDDKQIQKQFEEIPQRFHTLATMARTAMATESRSKLSRTTEAKYSVDSGSMMTCNDLESVLTSPMSTLLDLDVVNPDVPLTTVLLDLVMYENTSLVDIVLNFVIRQHMIVTNLLNGAKDVQILTNSSKVRSSDMMVNKLNALRNHFEAYEVWGDETEHFNPFDKDVYNEVISILKDLRQLCDLDHQITGDLSDSNRLDSVIRVSTFADLTGTSPMQKMNQSLLGRASAIEVLLEGLHIEVPKSDDGMPPYLKNIFREIYSLLTALVANHPGNQADAAKHVKKFLTHLEHDVRAAEAVCAIYHGNEKLCSTISEDVFENICQLNEQNGPSDKYLSIIRTVVAPRNKHVILKILLDNLNSERTLVLCNEPGSRMYEERIRWIEGAERGEQKSQDMLSYHTTLITVMARCDSGFDLFAEAKCQKLYPVEHVMHALLDKRHPLSLKQALGRYLYEVSLEADIKSSSLQQSPQMWKILENIAIFFETTKFRVLLKERDDVEEVSYSLFSALPCVSGFFHHYYQHKGALSSHQQIAERLVVALYNSDFFMVAVNPLRISDTAKNDLRSLPKCIDDIVKGILDPAMSELVVAPEHFTANSEAAVVHLNDDDNIQNKYLKQIEVLQKSFEVKNLVREEMKRLVWYIENIEDICAQDKSNAGHAKLTTKKVCNKFIDHMTQHINEEHIDTNISIMVLFQHMLEYHRDQGAENFTIAQKRLFEFGLHRCFIEGIAQSSPYQSKIMVTALKLGIEFLTDGALHEAQMVIVDYFLSKPESQFFDKVRMFLQLCTERLGQRRNLLARKKHADDAGTVLQFSEAEIEIMESNAIYDEVMLTLRFLQLLTEGHNNVTQELIGNQHHSQLSVDLCAEVVNLLEEMVKDISEHTINLVLQIFGTITEFIQGPCTANQTLLAKTSLIMVATTALVAQHDLRVKQLHILRNHVLITLTSMLERREDKAIHLQMQSTLQAKSLRTLLIECFEFLQIADDETDDMVKDEAANIYSLTGLLAVHCPAFIPNLDPDQIGMAADDKDQYATALKAIKKTMGHVEIFWNGKLERIFFAIPEMCEGLTSTRKKEVVWGVDRSSAEGKLSDFVEWSDVVFIYLNHEEKLRKRRCYRYISHISPFLLQTRLVLSLCINALLLVTLTTPGKVPTGLIINADPLLEWGVFKNETLSLILLIMGIINIICAFFLCMLTYATRGYLRMIRVSKSWKKANKDKQLKCWQHFAQPFVMIFQDESFESLLYLVFSALGMSGFIYFYSLLLLDVRNRSETLKNVVRAVTRPAKQLAFTMFFCSVLVYIFAIFGFWFFRTYFDGFDCSSMRVCMATFLDQGLRYGGGIGEYFDEHNRAQWESEPDLWAQFFVFNTLFFVTINIILLNIIFGVIIDTFSALREDLNTKLADMRTSCFICSLTRETLDRHSGFTFHIHHEHNMWQYLYYIVYLRAKDPESYTGSDQYVMNIIEADGIEWFPIRRALSIKEDFEDELETHETTNEALMNTLQGLIEEVQELKRGSEPALKQTDHGQQRARKVRPSVVDEYLDM